MGTHSPRSNMWMGTALLHLQEVFVLWGVEPSPSDRAVPADFQKTRLLCTTGSLIYKCLEETQLRNLMSIHAIQMNRGNKVFSLYRTTSGLTVAVMSTIGFNRLKLFSVTAYFVA